MSMLLEPALTSSMNALVPLVLVPVRNSLILIGWTLRTFAAVVSGCRPVPGFAHSANAVRSPLKDDRPELTRNVVLTVAPGSTVGNDVRPSALTDQPRGSSMLSFTPNARDPVVLVNVTVEFRAEPGVKVCSAGVRLSRCTSYLAATMLAC